MTSLLRLKKSVFLSWNRPALLFAAGFFCLPSIAQHLAAFHDNQGRFQIFDQGKIIQADYLPVKEFKVGANCILYIDNKDNFKMYAGGSITTLEMHAPKEYVTLDHFAVYSYGGIVKIIENGDIQTITTHAVNYQAGDSLVSFYDASQQLLAVYYKRKIHMLEDGISGNTARQVQSGDNIVAYISSATGEFKIFYNGENRAIEPFLMGGSYRTGLDIVGFVNNSDSRLRVFYKGEIFDLEDFQPKEWQAGDEILAYVDHMGNFKAFVQGNVVDIASFAPDFFKVVDQMIIYSEKGYFRVWVNDRSYLLENYIPEKWHAQWSNLIYRDISNHVKIFSNGETRVLTYDLAEDIALYRGVVLVNKGMNNHNVYYKGKKY